MSTIGQKEIATQKRVVALFEDTLGYDYLGHWIDREDNRNIEEKRLRRFLAGEQGYDEPLIARALFELNKVAGDQSNSLYDVNRKVYDLLRYGVRVKRDVGQYYETVWLIDWKNWDRNHFAIAEEVTVKGKGAKASTKRPDIVIYVNGIAVGVLELKRSTVSVAEGIRQNLDNQQEKFIRPFFTTMQFIMAGNDTEGLRYGAIETTEPYYLTWKEESEVKNPLDRALLQLCAKERFIELLRDFIVFDAGIKKICRPNQYFGVKAAQDHVRRRQGGIIWHTQGSGKSLTMVWLAKWIRENRTNARVLIVTDRTELDDQIEKVFLGVNEQIHRTKSGADLIATLNTANPWLVCSLIHKFGGKEEGDMDGFLDEMFQDLPPDFKAKGDLYVFVDECHRTQAGKLRKGMEAILPNAMFIGFTGTPLLQKDRQTSIEIFGPYIHTYKFDEAVEDKIILDLRYEARDIDQRITSPDKIDTWFEATTSGLTDAAKAQIKARWGTMQKVLSSQDRLGKIVGDIMMDMLTKDRLKSGHGNAMLISGSIYQACKFYELFRDTPLKDKCAIITSYKPAPADIKGEETGLGLTERLRQYAIYEKMLNGQDPEQFETDVRKKFVKEPGQMKLLIVVDKLLTGFDAPSATYLYIDKQMRDHGLFQAICRVNRLDGEDKEYGYIIDYKDLFRSLNKSIAEYTSDALDGYDPEDVKGLLTNRLDKARERLEELREKLAALCEHVEPPKGSEQYIAYFCGHDLGDKDAVKENEPKRMALYRLTSSLIRAYAEIANEMAQAGFSPTESEQIKQEAGRYESIRAEVKLASADYVDLKQYEPAMRHLIDTYIRAEESEKLTAFDDMSLVELIVQRGAGAIDALPEGIRSSEKAVAETIVNNVRKLIIDEQPINPKYYENMSDLLDDLIEQRRQDAIDYAEFLAQVIELAKQAASPSTESYPAGVDTPGKRALFDNLGGDADLAVALDKDIKASRQHGFRENLIKRRSVMAAIRRHVGDDNLVETIYDIVVNHDEY